MRTSILWHSAVALAIATPALMTAGDAAAAPKYPISRDEQVCYTDGGYNRYVLDVKFHSPLNFRGGFPQSTYDVVGKHTSQYGSYKHMEVLHGGIIVTKHYSSYGDYQFGARMGVESIGGLHYTKDVEVDCTTNYEDPTPEAWTCSINGETKYLKQVYGDDYLCGFFEDGGYSSVP
jgi:hypothetical protein